MATHSSIPAWKIPWTEQPGGLQSTGSQRVGHDWVTSLLLFSNHCRWWLQPWIKRHLLLGRKIMTNLDSILKSRDITLPTKVCLQSYDFSSNHVWMWELDHNEAWVPKNWCIWIVVLEKTLESPLDSKEIKPITQIGNQHWIFIWKTDAEAPILWPPD